MGGPGLQRVAIGRCSRHRLPRAAISNHTPPCADALHSYTLPCAAMGSHKLPWATMRCCKLPWAVLGGNVTSYAIISGHVLPCLGVLGCLILSRTAMNCHELLCLIANRREMP